VVQLFLGRQLEKINTNYHTKKYLAMSSPLKCDSIVGSVCVVTGGGSGIGLEVAAQLGAHGARVVCILGRREGVLQQAVQSLSASGSASASNGTTYMYEICDVRNYKSCVSVVQSVVSKHGNITVLINSAAGNFLSPAHLLSPKGFRTVVEIDLLGTFNMSHACFKSLANRASPRHSTIVNISATLHLPATYWQVHASAAKAGIDSLTRSLALEWGKYGINVNSVAPGPIENTAGMTKLSPTGGMDKEGIDKMVKEHIPVGRMGKKIDIAYFVVFLCGVGGEFISGANLVCDGGNMLYKKPMVPDDVVAEVSRKIEKASRL